MPRIIPVIDLMHGRVVRAVGGRRSEYGPVDGKLTDSTDPAVIAEAMMDAAGNREIYIADIDAIQSDGVPSETTVRLIRQLDATILLDHGWRGGVSSPVENANVHPIIPGECMTDLKCYDIDSATILFSIDMRQGMILGLDPTVSPFQHIQSIFDYGIRRVITLDLHEVGECRGLQTLNFCNRLRDRHGDIEIITGGGIRNRDDISKAGDAGVDAVLVSTALHLGMKLTGPER